MQFSIVFASIMAVAAAQYGNGTAPYPTGTAAPTGVVPSVTSSATPPPFTGAAVANAGSVFALLAAGGVAMML